MPARPRETSVIVHELRVAARPETVFAYFTDPARMVRWMGAEATLDPRPRMLLRLTAYQLAFLERVPAFAAVDDAVTLARQRAKPGVPQFVNAVLRSFVRRGPRG